MKLFKSIAILNFAFSILHSQGAVIDQVIVRQQWPWSTDVKIEYKLSQVTNPVDIAVRAYNGTTPLDNSRIAGALTGNRYGVTESVGTIILDPIKAFGNDKVAIADFRVELELSDSAANINEVIYRIVDLTNGNVEELSRADFYSNKGYGAFVTNYADIHAGFTTSLSPDDVFIWTGVTNNVEYKTTKLVLRKIPAKYKTFPYGTANCTLTNDYWMGVFDLTYEQYKTVVGSYAGSFTDKDGFETWPISGLSYNQFYNTVVSQLKSHVPSLDFAIPTEARLAFAMYGGAYDDIHGATAYGYVAWNKDNVATASPQTVGRKCPNAYGLYDAIGNVNQVTCEQNVGGSLPSTDVTEPQLTSGQSGYVTRGGSYNDRYYYAYVTSRSTSITYNGTNNLVGYRPYVK